MTKYTLLKCAVVVAVLGMMAGCATAPTQEMSDARQAVQAARDADANQHTPEAMEGAEHDLSQAEHELHGRNYKMARDDALAAKQGAIKARNMALAISQAKEAMAEADKLGALSQATRDWLTQAENAAASGKEQQTVHAAQQVVRMAHDDVQRFNDEQQRSERENQKWLDKAKPLLEEARRSEARMSGLQREALRRAEQAYQQGEGQKSYNLADYIMAEVHTMPPVARTKQYTVQRGDNLWRIAAKPSVYGNGLMWPLILRSNRERIHDADNLRLGQKLIILLNPDKAAVDAAVQYAIRREKAGGDLKALDKKFLEGTP